MSVRWGILGAGWIVQQATGQALREAPSATIAGAAARDTKRARALNPERVHDTYEALIEDESIDAVYIALANDQHAPLIHRAIDAGKHVLCEKPLTLSAAETRRAFDAANAAGVLLVEAAWTMWHPRMQRIVELASSGAIGPLRGFLGTFTFEGVPEGNYRLDPQRGGGALLDIGVYPLHALVSITTEQQGFDSTFERTWGGLGVDLTTKAHVEISSGLRASVVASFEMPESQRLVIDGEDVRVSVPDDQAFTSWREATTLQVGQHQEKFAPTDAYRDMFQAVSARILGQEAWTLPSEASIRVATLVDALR